VGDFYSCGNDGLGVMSLLGSVAEATIRLSGADIYAHPTIFEMGKGIQRAPNDASPRTAEDTTIPFLGISRHVS
jgi:hypothetical protein